MNSKSRFVKKIQYLFVAMCLVLNLIPMGNISYASDNSISHYTPKYYTFKDEEDLKRQIINSDDFIKYHAYLAHYMGFGWCGGTGSKYVGEDFSFKKDGDNYILQANYNKHDPHAGGYWADKRLRMTVSNVRFYIDTDSLKLGDEKVTKLDPVMLQSFDAINKGDTDDTANVSFTYTKDKTVSHSFTYSFEEGIQVNSTATVDVEFVSASCNYGWSFTAGQSWTNGTETASSTSVTTSYDTTVPAKSKKTVKLMSFKTKSDVPYTAKIYMEYDITFHGFLRYSGNARNDHPKKRPFVDVTFGNKDKSAQEQIQDIYEHRDINGYSDWDWSWMEKEFGADNVKIVVSQICRPRGAEVDGKFTCVDGTHVEVVSEDAVPLTDKELASDNTTTNSFAMSKKDLSSSLKSVKPSLSKGISIENIKFNDTPENRVTKSSVTTSSGTTTMR
ncbi:aerolysin family beta-barrel pore-forming toxin [Clostridiaceae bacterium M8S5]|nr:aerolysin family beta-barrel pore-forming toxin [Clostridiaceae bacterium M8S5]